jgi:hypothetical protein
MHEYEAGFERGRILLSETAPNLLIFSRYPHAASDPSYPGWSLETDKLGGFPYDTAISGEFEDVNEWVRGQPWAQPFPPSGQSIEGDPANRDACPLCRTPSFGAL